MDEYAFLPPYDFGSLEGVMLKLDAARGLVDRGAAITAWMKAGASNKDERGAALACYLRIGKLVGDATTLILTSTGEDDGVDDEDDAATAKAKAASAAAAAAARRAKLPPLIAGQVFLAEQVAAGGVQRLPSGMLFRVVTAGTGAKSPTPADECEVHYHGRLPSGAVFDSSRLKGVPARFSPSQVTAGFGMALQLMREGDTWEVFVPSELGYAARGSPPEVPGHSVLVFTIELLRVVAGGKPAADAEQMLSKLLESDDA